MTRRTVMTAAGRWVLRCLPVVAALELLSGCAVLPAFQNLPGGGIDTATGTITVDDIWVDGPHGIAAGASAPLRLALSNNSSTTADSLVGVSTPLAEHTRLEQDGHAVDAIALPAGGFVDLERTTGVELEGFRHSLTPGQWFPLTLTFAKAAPVTVKVAAGPLGYPEPRYGAPADFSTTAGFTGAFPSEAGSPYVDEAPAGRHQPALSSNSHASPPRLTPWTVGD